MQGQQPPELPQEAISSETLLFKHSTMNMHVLITLVGAAMVGVGGYLTKHFYNVRYPTGLGSGSLCDINSFFNCDAATHSVISNIAGVPIAAFGAILGVLILAGYLFQNKAYEGTLHNILRVNLVGCALLFIYSLVALGALCPFCTLYYILSAIAFFIFHKKSEQKQIDFKTLGIMAIPVLIFSGIFGYTTADKEKIQLGLAKSLMGQYDKLPVLGNPAWESPYRSASATPKFEDAPIRITKFSDFQCPGCKMLNDTLDNAARRYKGKINIQYFFYPLDMKCNPKMERPLHPEACMAAYLAACLPQKFEQVHKDIFDNQTQLSDNWIKAYAAKEKVEACLTDPATQEIITKMLSEAAPFNVESTPTMLVNGVKIEGSIPDAQLFLILDELAARAGQSK